MNPSNTFSKLSITAWRQFASVEIDFHPRLTVITGANAAGKSTLLNILGRHFGAERPYLAVPKHDKDGKFLYLKGNFTLPAWLSRIGKRLRTDIPDQEEIGEVKYSNGTIASLRLPPNVGIWHGNGGLFCQPEHA